MLRATILGCGSSPGVPRPNGDWGACDPTNPKNRRRRASLLVERVTDSGTTTVVVDTGPDFRDQMIDAGVKKIDAVLYTHAHADHSHGIDDLRTFAMAQRRRLPVYADAPTFARLNEAFGYCFNTPPGSDYPPILDQHPIGPGQTFNVAGEGGSLPVRTFALTHGSITILGFRFGGLAYCTDTSDIPEGSVEALTGLDMLIIDALQYHRHPSHLSLQQSLQWIERLSPRRALLTHMHIPLDYETVLRETPDHVQPAFDGAVIEFE